MWRFTLVSLLMPKYTHTRAGVGYECFQIHRNPDGDKAVTEDEYELMTRCAIHILHRPLNGTFVLSGRMHIAYAYSKGSGVT